MEWSPLPAEFSTALPVLAWKSDAEGRLIWLNDRALVFIGGTLEQALAGAWQASIHPDDAGPLVAASSQARAVRDLFETEYRLRRADGVYRRVREWIRPQFDDRGCFQGTLGLALDNGLYPPVEEQLQWLSAVVEQGPASIIITDLNGNIVYVNQKFSEVTGYRLEEVLGRNPRILKSGEMQEEEYRNLWTTIQAGEWRGEFHNRKKNGDLFWESASISPIRDQNGKPVKYIAIKEEITERKRMETAVREAERRFRIAIENAQLSVYDIDARTGTGPLYGKDHFLQSFRDWAAAIHPDDRDRVLAAHRRGLENGQAVEQEYRVVDRDGHIRHLADRGGCDYEGRWIGVLQDITRAKQAEADLARLAAIVRCSSDAIVSLDTRGVITTWNAAAERLFGYRAEQIIGQHGLTLSPPYLHAAAARNIASILSGTPLLSIETHHMRSSGVAFPVSITASPIFDQDGKTIGLSAIIRDITEKKRVRKALMASENRFRALVLHSNDLITLVDRAGKVLYDSPGILELLGVSPEQRLGHSLYEWYHAEDIPHLRSLHEKLLTEQVSNCRAQLRLRHADGSWRWCDGWVTNLMEEPGVRAWAVSYRDITQLKDVETALRESEERYRRLIQDASDSIFTIDLTGNITSSNGARLSGYSSQELVEGTSGGSYPPSTTPSSRKD